MVFIRSLFFFIYFDIKKNKQETQFCILLKPVFSGISRGGLKFTDEPTGNLDEDTAMGIIGILKESAHQMNKCVVDVTHSNELAKEADVVFLLKRGELKVSKESRKK